MGEWEGQDIQTRQKREASLAKIREIDLQLAELERRSEGLAVDIHLVGATGGIDVGSDVESISNQHKKLEEEKVALLRKLDEIV